MLELGVNLVRLKLGLILLLGRETNQRTLQITKFIYNVKMDEQFKKGINKNRGKEEP